MATKTLKSKTNYSLQTPTEKRASTAYSNESRRKQSFCDKPTPLDFDTFVPWVCMEWQVPEVVTVLKIAQEKFIRSDRRGSSAKPKSTKSLKQKEEDESITKKINAASATTTAVTSSISENIIPIKAYYDSHSRLAEIVIDSCVTALHRKVIQAISLCIPFHSFLTKLVIRKGGLNYILLYEISKLLPHSNLTDICLDDTYVPEGNYYVLLDHTSNLKYLSLNRCKINDNVCKEIALRIDFGGAAEKSLRILDLSTNLITDVGAKYFGDVLRRNRHLLHLNFLGNKISDTGFDYLMKHLHEFPLTYEEILDMRSRNFQYYQRKKEIYDRCVEEIARTQKSESIQLSEKNLSFSNKHSKFKKTQKPAQQRVEVVSHVDLAEKMTKDMLGKRNIPFDDVNCFRKDNYYYSIGNFKLCSLNVAYNNLEFGSLLKILKILKYQCLLRKQSAQTGLLRIVLEGNYFPNSCPELEKIFLYLNKATNSLIPISTQQQTSMKRRTSIHLKQR